MRRYDRLFEIVQMLRSADTPITAAEIAEEMEVSARTVYRDIAVLRGMRVPIDGEAGLGYVMRSGYDLPPLNFDVEECQAIAVGLKLLSRTGDRAMQASAACALSKIVTVAPAQHLALNAEGLYVSDWGPTVPPDIDLLSVRAAIRHERKIFLHYLDLAEQETRRTVLPLALVYYTEAVVLAGWCELRNGFRHFRADRIRCCVMLEEFFQGSAADLRRDWELHHRFRSE